MNEDAFSALCEKNRRSTLAYLYACCRNLALAEDMAQETLLIAFRKKENYFPEASFSGWLVSIARNVWFRERAKLAKQGAVVPLDEIADNHAAMLFDASQYDDEAWKAREQALDGCLRKLHPEDRRLLDSHFNDGRPYADMAKSLRKSLAWMKVKMFRIRQNLLLCMRKALQPAEAL